MGRPVDQPSEEKEKRTGNFASGPRVKLLHLPDSLRFIDLVDYCRFGMASDSRNGCGPAVLLLCRLLSSPSRLLFSSLWTFLFLSAGSV